MPSSSVISAATVGSWAEGAVGCAPAARVDLDHLAACDHPEHVDVVDRHVEQVRVRHPPPPVAARDPGVAEVAAAGDADAEQPRRAASSDEVAQRAWLPPKAVVLRHHRVPAGRVGGSRDRPRHRRASGRAASPRSRGSRLRARARPAAGASRAARRARRRRAPVAEWRGRDRGTWGRRAPASAQARPSAAASATPTSSIAGRLAR